MEARSCDADHVFRVYTACPQDIATILLDVRAQKEFKQLHLFNAFCVRLSSNGKVLADYSQSSYNIKWAQDCWWNKHVVVYGGESLKRDHPVVEFLARGGRCKSVHYFKEGFSALEKKLPFLCTTSVRAKDVPKYPALILTGFLYLGDWAHACDEARLRDIGVRSIITIHNHPENLSPPSCIKAHLRLELADIDSADISTHFQPAYEFLEAARLKGHSVLVHCGAGVSRSATLVMMYLMRRNVWPAHKARDAVKAARSMVCINDGFWRTLCALEGSLGVSNRSDPAATSGFHGADADEPMLCADAAGRKVEVKMLPASKRSAPEGEEQPAQISHGSSQHQADTKRQKQEDEGVAGSRAGTAAATGSGLLSSGMGVKIVMEVSKPDGPVGQLQLGPLAFHQRAVFGRQPGSEVLLEHASISRQHAQISVDASGACFISDLGSAHGTRVGDVWVRANTPKQLRPGTVLRFGASTRVFTVNSISREALTAPQEPAR